MKKQKLMTPDLVNTPVYNDEMMNNVLEGVAQNIHLEMEKIGVSLRELSDISGVSYSHLSRIFNSKNNMSLPVFFKLAYALHMNPRDLLPYDVVNKRKTYGELFDEMIKGTDLHMANFLLKICADFTREYRRIQRK